MTDKQKEDLIDFNNSDVFRTENYQYAPNYKEYIIGALSIIIGDYKPYRKRAALILLKVFIRDKYRKLLLNDNGIYPISRNDSRVRKWIKDVKKIGHCEICNSTENLQAHHIINWSDYPQGRIDIKNGQCLCVNCHADMHKEDSYYELIKSTQRRNKSWQMNKT